VACVETQQGAVIGESAAHQPQDGGQAFSFQLITKDPSGRAHNIFQKADHGSFVILDVSVPSISGTKRQGF